MKKRKTKPMRVNMDWGNVDFEIERDCGNPILILMGRDEYALANYRKLKRLCNTAIKILKKRIQETKSTIA